MKKTAFLVAVLAFGFSVPLMSSHGDDAKKRDREKPQEPDGKIKELMRRKLTHAQKVLEGIALNDFDPIAKHARELRRLSETAEWKVFPTPQYLLHSNEFQRAAEKLIADARDKNLDGAALAYVELTLNCVRCHKYVREVRMTPGDEERPWLAQQEGGKR